MTNYSFTDDLRSVALMGGSNPHMTDQELVEMVIRKANEQHIELKPEQVTVQRIGTPGAPAVYVAAEYSVPVSCRAMILLCTSNLPAGNRGF